MKLQTEVLKYADISPEGAKKLAQKLHQKKEDIPFIRKYYTADKSDIVKGERAVISYISTSTKDRDGEQLMPGGADLEHFRSNPVVMYGHDYKTLPIGKNMWIKSDEKGLVAKTAFAKNEFADEIYRAYTEDINGTGPLLTAWSVGFIPIEHEDVVDEKSSDPMRRYTKWELLEYSAVPIPSCPEALTIAIGKGIVKSLQLKQDLGGGEPKIEKIEDVAGFEVWRVDGAYIRANIDKDFTNFGQHYHCSYIPDKEFWLDKEASGDETQFFIDHLLTEYALMAKGEGYEQALVAADRKESDERASAGGKEMTPGVMNGSDAVNIDAHLSIIGESENFTSWLVDGEVVRDNYWVDFTEGGHGYVYDFIPKNEVWIDDDVEEAERPFILIHELDERYAIAKGGLTYDKAHKQALKVEYDARQKPGEVETVLKSEVAKNEEIKQMTDIVTKPETTENYHRIPVEDAGAHKGHRIRTIDISAKQGIKALYCGECKKVITYMFDVNRWTMEEAKKWVADHKEGKAVEDETTLSMSEIVQTIDGLTSTGTMKIKVDALKDTPIEASVLAEIKSLRAELLEQKEGRVLSAKNRELIKSCADMLMELHKATEPQGQATDEGKAVNPIEVKSEKVKDEKAELIEMLRSLDLKSVIRDSVSTEIKRIRGKVE